MSVFDEPFPGAPKTTTTVDNVTKFHEIDIAKTIRLSKEGMEHMLHKIVMRKLSANRATHLFTTHNRRNREATS